MQIIARLIQVVFSLYAIGLIAYCLLGWFGTPQSRPFLEKLGRFYRPVLTPVQSMFAPVRIGTTRVDLSPAIVLLALVIVRELVMYILLGSVGW